MNKNKSWEDFIKTKIIYLNWFFAIDFMLGVILAIIGFTPLADNSNHFTIIESFGLPMVGSALAYWTLESTIFLKQHFKERNRKHD